MKLTTALELKNRTRADAPVVVVVAGPSAVPSGASSGASSLPSSPTSSAELERRVLQAAAGRVEVLGVAGADRDREIQQFLDEAGIAVLPAVLVYARGVLLERSSVVRDARAATALLSVLPGLR